MIIVKRNGKTQNFDGTKISKAIMKACIEIDNYINVEDVIGISKRIEESATENMTVEQIQDAVELELTKEHPEVAVAYIRYRDKQARLRALGWNLSDLGKRIHNKKYIHEEESFDAFLERICNGNEKLIKHVRDKRFLFGGRILAGRKLTNKKKLTLSNCYVIPSPEDNIEDIWDKAKELARTFSYGGGGGTSLNKLRPRGMVVNNSANETTGAVSFMELFNVTTKIIGQKNRRGALMLILNVNHPDIAEFIKSKTDVNDLNYCNISVQITDDFMNAVKANEMWQLKFECSDTGEVFTREIHARNLLQLIAKCNWKTGEPGMLFWDRINNWHLMSEVPGYTFSATNPCGELPLMDYGACLLGSINLSEFVKDPFTSSTYIDIDKLSETVHDAVIALNEVLDENIQLHPLKQQQDYARDYRPIGLGIMGLADMFLKLGLQYGDEKSFQISEELGFFILNETVHASVLLAKEKGAFPKCDIDAILASPFVQANIHDDLKDMIKEYGIYNCQLLAIAPTGSISTMLGVSGGIEPHFNIKFTRKVESVGEEDEYYEVLVPIVDEFLKARPDLKEDDIRIATNVPYQDRLKMQSIWQKYVDNAISSTCNLHTSATIEDIEDLYIMAWELGLKGVTVYRDGCERTGILTTPDKKDESKCPECNGEMQPMNGCTVCKDCGYSPCSV